MWSDGRCVPNNGPACESCSELEEFTQNYYYGLHAGEKCGSDTGESAKIILHGLAKKSVSYENIKRKNWGGDGEIIELTEAAIKRKAAAEKAAVAKKAAAAKKFAAKMTAELASGTALSWSPEMGSVERALAKQKKSGVKILYLMRGTHVVEGYTNDYGDYHKCATIDFSVNVRGEGPGETIVEGGFWIRGDSTLRVKLETMTVTNPKGYAVCGKEGVKFDAKEVSFDKCSRQGLYFCQTICKLTNCTVTNCEDSGILTDGGQLHFAGKTKVTRNCCRRYNNPGIFTAQTKIIFHNGLTKETVSFKNERENWGVPAW